MDLQQWFSVRQSRRRAIRNLSILAGIGLSIDAGVFAAREVSASSQSNPIGHILIASQENHSFDTYFGYYPRAGAYGVPHGYSQPDGHGGTVTPHHYFFPFVWDTSHTWQDIHREWDKGAMDGFYTTDGSDALGYYDGSDLTYYYALADAFTLCGNYFCSVLGPTVPNRLALVSGTAGGNTTDTLNPGSVDWPTIVDLLDAHHVSWKCYNLGLGLGSFPEVEFLNALPLFKRWQHDHRLHYPAPDFYNDLSSGTIPQVTFLITDAFISEHPHINPSLNIQSGQKAMAKVINALMA